MTPKCLDNNWVWVTVSAYFEILLSPNDPLIPHVKDVLCDFRGARHREIKMGRVRGPKKLRKKGPEAAAFNDQGIMVRLHNVIYIDA